MKNCPVCNTQVEDHYTGLCPNSLCSWEFEFISSEMTPELQKRYAEKLAKCRHLYELNIASDKRISTLKDKKDKIKEEFNPKIYRANIIAFIFKGLLIIFNGILIYIQFKGTLPIINDSLFIGFVIHFCLTLYSFLGNYCQLFGKDKSCRTDFDFFDLGFTIHVTLGYICFIIIFILSESELISIVSSLGIFAIVGFLLNTFGDYLEERLKK